MILISQSTVKCHQLGNLHGIRPLFQKCVDLSYCVISADQDGYSRTPEMAVDAIQPIIWHLPWQVGIWNTNGLKENFLDNFFF